MHVVDISEVKPVVWDAFVERHPLGNVFQTHEMYDLYRRVSNNEPIALAVEENEKLIGVMLANIVSNGGKIMQPFTARSIINGGPLALDNDEKIFRLLMSSYKKHLPWYVVYSEVRPIYDMIELEDSFRSFGFERKGHYNLVLNLHKAKPDLWQQLHKERQRNIRQAEKIGLVFREVNSDNEVSIITELVEQTYKRKRVPLSFTNMFTQLKQIMGCKARFFGAYYEDKMIAGQVRLCYRDMVYAWFAGSDDAFFKLRPNDFLMWNVICWSHDMGYGIFDFGGGGEPGVPYGVRDYKLKYGCEQHEYGRYLKIHHPLTFKIGEVYSKLIIKR